MNTKTTTAEHSDDLFGIEEASFFYFLLSLGVGIGGLDGLTLRVCQRKDEEEEKKAIHKKNKQKKNSVSAFLVVFSVFPR
jgi:hypothetical protein